MHKAAKVVNLSSSLPPNTSHTGAVTTTQGDTQTLTEGLTHP